MRIIVSLFICWAIILVFSGTSSATEKVFFYTTDPTGSPVAITDSTGNVVWRADYKPFGQEQSISGSLENNERFIGKEKDKETGLDYFGARYMYDKAGRFTSPDPIGPVDPKTSQTNHGMLLNPQKLNAYAYAGNNPYRYIDPWGLEWKDWQENVKATIEGTTKQNPLLKSATPYGKKTDSDEFVALPDEHLRGKQIEIEANGKKVVTEVGDVGPWNGGHSKKGTDFNDPYWDTNRRPQTENSEKDKRGRTLLNEAGIDISAKLGEKLGLKGSTIIRWRGLP